MQLRIGPDGAATAAIREVLSAAHDDLAANGVVFPADPTAAQVWLVHISRPDPAMLELGWHEELRSGSTLSFPAYVDQAAAPDSSLSWTGADDPDLVTVLEPVDEDDLLDSLERLLDLPVGLLRRHRRERELTFLEAEALREVNRVFVEEGCKPKEYGPVVRRGVAAHLAGLPPLPGDSGADDASTVPLDLLARVFTGAVLGAAALEQRALGAQRRRLSAARERP